MNFRQLSFCLVTGLLVTSLSSAYATPSTKAKETAAHREEVRASIFSSIPTISVHTATRTAINAMVIGSTCYAGLCAAEADCSLNGRCSSGFQQASFLVGAGTYLFGKMLVYRAARWAAPSIVGLIEGEETE